MLSSLEVSRLSPKALRHCTLHTETSSVPLAPNTTFHMPTRDPASTAHCLKQLGILHRPPFLGTARVWQELPQCWLQEHM